MISWLFLVPFWIILGAFGVLGVPLGGFGAPAAPEGPRGRQKFGVRQRFGSLFGSKLFQNRSKNVLLFLLFFGVRFVLNFVAFWIPFGVVFKYF